MKIKLLLAFIALTLFSYSQQPVVLGYFPSWSETWASPGGNSPLREVPDHLTHVFFSFAKPNLTYVSGSYDLSGTGIEVPYDGCTLKESVKVLKDRGIEVILSVGGETYWSSGDGDIYNINYQMIKDLVDDIGFAGIDWDFEPNGSFSNIGSQTNVDYFIEFITESRALMPASEGYIIACAPSGVGAMGGLNNDDAASPFAYANRNTLTGETDASLYSATTPTNGISLFGFSATGHMIPVFEAVGSDIDLVAFQGYNVGASTNREIMYDSYAYYAEIYNFQIAAGVHFPNEPWGPYYTYNHANVASLSEHIKTHTDRVGDGDGIMIWQQLMAGPTASDSSAYSYLHVSADVLNGATESAALADALNWSTVPYSGPSTFDCTCEAPTPNLGADQDICGTTSITLNSSVIPATGVTFTWKKDGVTLVNASATQNTYTITEAGSYTVQVAGSGCVNSDVIVISDQLPTPNLTEGVSVCQNPSAALNSGVTSGVYSFAWFLDNNSIAGSTSTLPISLPGTYRVEVSATGCTTTQDEVVVVNNAPAIDLGEGVNLCSPATATLLTGYSTSNYNFIWKKDNVTINSETAASLAVSTPGTYSVEMNASGCSASTSSVAITSSLPQVVNDTICETGVANLTSDVSVNWYASETSTTSLHTGASYNPTIANTTSYWVANEGGGTLTGTTLRSSYEGGWLQNPNLYANKIIVDAEVTFNSVTVQAELGDIQINFVASDGVTIIQSFTFPNIQGTQALDLGITLQPGTYYINSVGSTANFHLDTEPEASNFVVAGLFTVEGEAYVDWTAPYGDNYSLSSDYGHFTNLTYSSGPQSCDRIEVMAVLDPTNANCAGATDCTGLTTYGTDVQSNCGSYQWINGVTYTASNTTANHTLVNAAGCDSIVTLDLTILNPSASNVSATICTGETYTLGTQNLTASGEYMETFTNSVGCDSVVTLNLTVANASSSNISATICNGSSYTLGTQNLTASGEYMETFTNSVGCDSVVTLNLTVANASSSNISATICNGSSYTLGTQSLTASGEYMETFTNSVGCDSVVTLNLTVSNSISSSIAATICNGSSYTLGTQNLTTAGEYMESFTSVSGCDSIVTLNLTVQNPTTTNTSTMICTGSSYTFGTQNLTVAGQYTETFTNSIGCDSIVVLDLTVADVLTSNVSATICNGDNYTLGAQIITSAGEYTETFTSVSGCDSIVTLNLTVVNATSADIAATICNGESYTLGTQNLTTAGEYMEIFTNSVGCDSIVTLNLMVENPSSSTLAETICGGESYTFGNQILSVAGDYTEVFTNSVGCDSTVSLTLSVTVLNAEITESNGTLEITEVDNATYQWLDCNNAMQPISDAVANTFTPTTNGTYACEITVGNCTAQSTCFVYEVNGLEDNANAIEMLIYPNPTKGVLFVKGSPFNGKVDFTVLDTSGKTVQAFVQDKNEFSTTLNLSKGVYFLRMVSNNTIKVQKIVVQ